MKNARAYQRGGEHLTHSIRNRISSHSYTYIYLYLSILTLTPFAYNAHLYNSYNHFTLPIYIVNQDDYICHSFLKYIEFNITLRSSQLYYK